MRELNAVFRCERDGKARTQRGCLRLQLERRPPVRTHCVSGKCAQGREIRSRLAHVRATTCKRCGTALIPGLLLGVAPGECPTCDAET